MAVRRGSPGLARSPKPRSRTWFTLCPGSRCAALSSARSRRAERPGRSRSRTALRSAPAGSRRCSAPTGRGSRTRMSTWSTWLPRIPGARAVRAGRRQSDPGEEVVDGHPGRDPGRSGRRELPAASPWRRRGLGSARRGPAVCPPRRRVDRRGGHGDPPTWGGCADRWLRRAAALWARAGGGLLFHPGTYQMSFAPMLPGAPKSVVAHGARHESGVDVGVGAAAVRGRPFRAVRVAAPVPLPAKPGCGARRAAPSCRRGCTTPATSGCTGSGASRRSSRLRPSAPVAPAS